LQARQHDFLLGNLDGIGRPHSQNLSSMAVAPRLLILALRRHKSGLTHTFWRNLRQASENLLENAGSPRRYSEPGHQFQVQKHNLYT
jgi:predicted HD phosphohydrolase